MMSNMQTKTAGRRPRRRFSSEFKAGAVRLVLEEGKTIGQVNPAEYERRTQAA